MHALPLETPAARPLPDWAPEYDRHRSLDNKPFRSLCYAPFTTLDFGPTGEAIVCCANSKYIVGNVRTQSLKEIWTGSAMKTIRATLRAYQFADGCDKCEWQIAQGDLQTTYSKRDDIYALDASWEKGPLKMDFRLANTCNLGCIMCSGALSSTIRREVEKLPPLDCFYPDSFFSELDSYIPHLRYSWFTGGEPFLVQNNYRVWDLFIKHGNRVKCRITTNGTILTSKVRHYLERLQLADLSISIDGATPETFEAIRRKASFEEVIHNLTYFADYCKRKKTNLHFNVCGLAANWRELPDIFLLARKFGASVWSNIVQIAPDRTPERAVSMLEMPDKEKREAAAYLAKRYKQIEPELDEESRANYQVHLNTLSGPKVVNHVHTGTS